MSDYTMSCAALLFPRPDFPPYMLSRNKEQRGGSCGYYTQMPNVTFWQDMKRWMRFTSSADQSFLVKCCVGPRGLGVFTLLSTVFLTFVCCNSIFSDVFLAMISMYALWELMRGMGAFTEASAAKYISASLKQIWTGCKMDVRFTERLSLDLNNLLLCNKMSQDKGKGMIVVQSKHSKSSCLTLSCTGLTPVRI